MQDQYSRTQLLLGKEAMEKLHNSRVAVFGIGGVGGYTVEALARSGVGALDLIDDDKVCLTNLNRQIIATRKTVGKFKVDVAEERVHDIDPDIKVTTYKTFFGPETQDSFDFSQFDYVVDAIDTVTGKLALVMKCKEAGVPIICSMGAGNKMDPTRFEVTDIYKTSVCPLAKVMRTECRKRKIKHLKVVYSKEPVMTPIEDDSISCKDHCICPPGTQRKCTARRTVPGSNAFVPSVAGLIIGGEVVNVTADVVYNGRAAYEGAYVRLVDINGSEAKRLKLLAAIQNPDCGWFYRRGADTFKQIPGIPIAYWASDALLDAFGNAKQLSEYGKPRQGLATGENARFVREWWEVDDCKSVYSCGSIQESIESACKWFPYNKGGDFRKWYGNNSSVVNWENDGQEIRNYKDQNGRLLSRPQNTNCFFSPSITWSKISSGSIAFRFKPAGHIFDVAGTSVFSDEESLKYLQGACNSSVIMRVASMLSPTLNFEVGQIATYPIIQNEEQEPLVNDMVDSCRELSKTDWDSFETSWDFKRNPLV